MTDVPAIACTLAPTNYKERITSIATLNRDALQSFERRDLVLELCYAPEARDRVRDMIGNEQSCCGFLRFDLQEGAEDIRLLITAPEAAREAAGPLFEQFVSGAPSSCGCAPCARDASPPEPANKSQHKAAMFTKMTLATGAAACAACCTIPLLFPAALIVAGGGTVAWFAKPELWVVGVSMAILLGGLGWIACQGRRKRCKSAEAI